MIMRPSRLASLFAVAFLFGAIAWTHAPIAHAQQPDAKKELSEKERKKKAGKLYGEANKLFKEEKWAEAIEKFKAADESWPGAAPKWKIAEATDKLGDDAKTLEAYRTFVDSKPGAKYEDRVAVANKRIAEIEATMPATLTITVTPADAKNLSVAVDGAKLEGTSTELKAGEHTVIITADGFQPKTEVLNLKGNEKKDLQIALAPVAKPAPPPPPKPTPKPPEPKEEPETSSNIPAYVTLGIAGAGVVLGTVFGVMALGAKSDFDDSPTTENADDAERAALIADMSFGVALTFGITGAVLLFSGGDDDEESAETGARPVVVPYAGPTGGGVAATWTF
jgi:hypothetical protein